MNFNNHTPELCKIAAWWRKLPSPIHQCLRLQGDNRKWIQNKSFISFFLRNELRIIFIFYLIYIFEIRKKSFYSIDYPLALITRRRRLSKALHAARTTCSSILAQIRWITFLNSGKVVYFKFLSCPRM
jgi:hypothetical protein